MGIHLNYLAILVATILSMVLGFLWYSKFFSKPWAKHFYGVEECMTPPTSAVMMKSMALYLVGAFLTSYVLALGLGLFWQYRLTLGVETTVVHSLEFSFLIFLGFFVPFHLGRVSWEFRSWHTVVIGAGYDFVRLLIVTTLFWHWR